MYKPVKFITKIPYNFISTYYLFHKEKQILLPIEILNQDKCYIPSIYNTVKRLLNAAEVSVTALKVYKFSNDTFYTYLSIKKRGSTLDINIDFKDGIEISKETSCPIFIEEGVLKSCGIKITKDMVVKALKETQGHYLER
jgi:bifunctional DNase/RNase